MVKAEHDIFLEHPIIKSMINKKIAKMGVRYIMAFQALVHVLHMVIFTVAARPELLHLVDTDGDYSRKSLWAEYVAAAVSMGYICFEVYAACSW